MNNLCVDARKGLLCAGSGESPIEIIFGGVSDLCRISVGFTSTIVRHAK